MIIIGATWLLFWAFLTIFSFSLTTSALAVGVILIVLGLIQGETRR